MEFFYDIARYAYLHNALAACILSGIACGIMGTYVVCRRTVFLAGGIIPSVFLPELVQKVGNMTVTALWMDGIRFIASGGETGAVPVLWKLAAVALACFALALAAGKRRD